MTATLTQANNTETARAAWRLIVDAARRVRPLCDEIFRATSDDEPTDSLCRAIGMTALESRGILSDFYHTAEFRGKETHAVDGQLIDAMRTLLVIATLANVLAKRPREFESFKIESIRIANDIDAEVYLLEDQTGGDWAHADPSTPEKWMTQGAA